MMEHIDIGYIDIPKEYNGLTQKRKDEICDILIEKLLIAIDKELPEYMSRFEFLIEVLESSLQANEDLENYEICQVLNDILKQLNADRD